MSFENKIREKERAVSKNYWRMEDITGSWKRENKLNLWKGDFWRNEMNINLKIVHFYTWGEVNIVVKQILVLIVKCPLHLRVKLGSYFFAWMTDVKKCWIFELLVYFALQKDFWLVWLKKLFHTYIFYLRQNFFFPLPSFILGFLPLNKNVTLPSEIWGVLCKCLFIIM